MEVSILTRLSHLRFGSVRSSHLQFKKKHLIGYVRSSLPTLMHVGLIATTLLFRYEGPRARSGHFNGLANINSEQAIVAKLNFLLIGGIEMSQYQAWGREIK